MPRPSETHEILPLVVEKQLKELGANLLVARKRRGESRAAWSLRLGVTSPTLIRMEKGDPKVSMGAYATALWLIGRVDAIGLLAAPHLDYAAADAEARKHSAKRPRNRVQE
jgi:DNA-binding XRE family transcriptional regulator